MVGPRPPGLIAMRIVGRIIVTRLRQLQTREELLSIEDVI